MGYMDDDRSSIEMTCSCGASMKLDKMNSYNVTCSVENWNSTHAVCAIQEAIKNKT